MKNYFNQGVLITSFIGFDFFVCSEIVKGK
jgi:hypothetical protein